jgi:hypothetical protein
MWRKGSSQADRNFCINLKYISYHEARVRLVCVGDLFAYSKGLVKMRIPCILAKFMGNCRNIFEVLKIVHNKVMTVNNVN